MYLFAIFHKVHPYSTFGLCSCFHCMFALLLNQTYNHQVRSKYHSLQLIVTHLGELCKSQLVNTCFGDYGIAFGIQLTVYGILKHHAHRKKSFEMKLKRTLIGQKETHSYFRKGLNLL